MGKRIATIPHWAPFLVGFLVFLTTLWLWRAFSANENHHIHLMVHNETTNVQNAIKARMQARVLALVRMARRWEKNGFPSQREGEAEAELILGHFPDYRAIAWIDPWFFLRWTTPLENEEAKQEFNLAFAERRRSAMEAVQNRREVAVTHAVEILPGVQGFFIYVPIFRGEHFSGILAGAIDYTITPIRIHSLSRNRRMKHCSISMESHGSYMCGQKKRCWPKRVPFSLRLLLASACCSLC